MTKYEPPFNATRIHEALADAYAECERPEHFLVIVLDALDQAGAPLTVQQAVRKSLAAWEPDATYDAFASWEAVQI